MKLISHRGNMIGPNLSRENSPSYIDTAISAGYDVEVDINYLDNKFFLGHDTPDYEISEIWMEKRKHKIWFHCKNLDAASRLCELQKNYETPYMFFCHTSDNFVLTSTNHIWVHNLELNLNDKCIIPLLSDTDLIFTTTKKIYAICTDYINLSKSIYLIV